MILRKFSKIRNESKVRWLFVLAILVEKYFWPKKDFVGILKNLVFGQKYDYLNRFLVKFPFYKCILYILYLTSFQVTTKIIFAKHYKIARVALSLTDFFGRWQHVHYWTVNHQIMHSIYQILPWYLLSAANKILNLSTTSVICFDLKLLKVGLKSAN